MPAHLPLMVRVVMMIVAAIFPHPAWFRCSVMMVSRKVLRIYSDRMEAELQRIVMILMRMMEMNVGMLWFDDSASELVDKVTQVTRYYRSKHGAAPNVCYVHPSALGGKEEASVGDVRVKSGSAVLRHHFWVGREDISREMS